MRHLIENAASSKSPKRLIFKLLEIITLAVVLSN